MRVATLLIALLGAAGALCATANIARAECAAPPPPEAPATPPPATGSMIPLSANASNGATTGEVEQDRGRRVVAPVSINGQGPFRFIVDTGANRSVLSQGLADRLGLTSENTGEVNSIDGVTIAPLVDVTAVSYRGLDLPSAPLPVMQGRVFEGEQGLLGVDGMEGRRLRIDLEHGCVEIRPSEGAPRLINWATVRGQLRFGHLVVVPARIRDVRINVIVDTGSDSSLANVALRDALRAHLSYDQSRLDFARAYTAGLPVVLDSAIATPKLELGDLEIDHIFAYVGDFHIFELWGLQDEPTLLIGMDVISQVRGLAIDYGRSLVQFQLADPRGVGLFYRAMPSHIPQAFR